MKARILFFMIFASILSKAQINESFSDGNFNKYPEWTGDTANFRINTHFQLQSSATGTSVSSLFTNSESIVNAEWRAHFIINYTTSASNYAAMYIIADYDNISAGCNGYYVQIGGTNDEISLFIQEGTKKTKIIDGRDKRIADEIVNVEVKVTRDKNGNFELWSKKISETDFSSEGKVLNDKITKSYYFGLLYSNTSTTGRAYIFDDIMVKGEKADYNTAPEIS
jgi:hypothetical protein